MDWEFEVEMMPEVKGFDAFARIKHHRNYQSATLQFLDPEKIPEDWEGTKDLEVTIVHELIHTRFIYCFTPKAQNHHQEMAIETVAKVMVALKRGVDPEDLV
jgi:hypothetical protein